MLDTKRTYYILFFDILFVLLCSIGIFHITKKPNLPFEFTFQRNGIQITDNSPLTNALITNVDGYIINSQDQLEMILDSKFPGEFVNISYTINGESLTSNITLTNFYSDFYIITCGFLTFVFILIGVIVYLKRLDQTYALIYHWLCIGVAGIISLTWGNYNIGLFGAGILARIGFHLSYTFTPVIFLHFAYTFPRRIEFLRKSALTAAYSLAAILFIAGSFLFVSFFTNQDQSHLESYTLVFDIYRIHVILWILTSIVVFIHSFKTSPYKSEKQKLLWLILGFIIGPGSFVALWAIPQVLSISTLVPEELILILMTSIPITFAIAILKYRLMDIEVVITRGFVYSFTLALLYSFYLFLIFILSELTHTLIGENITSVISFGIAALLFHPVRLRVEKFIDRKFYGVRYNFRETFKNIVEEIKDINTTEMLSKKLVKRIDELIVINSIGFFAYDPDESTFSLIAHKGYDKFNGRAFDADADLINIQRTAAHSDKIEPGLPIAVLKSNLVDEFNAHIMFPIITEKEYYGMLLLGSKQSGLKYTIEDIDLIESVASRAALTIDRIKLQESIIRNQLEMEKLDELNQMKSFFVSSVSHDLKTPLTSIKMFTDFLKKNENDSQKKEEYLNIIEGETDRLTRLIDNVLDLTKIEKNMKQYQFEKLDLNEVMSEVLLSIEYQIKMTGFTINKKISRDSLLIKADKDSVIRSIINLVNNALKFSTSRKEIVLSTFKQNGFECVEITDYGTGMEKYEVENIFDPYVTSQDQSYAKYKGAGLGLAIVKHTMDAHKGLVTVTSVKNEGSTFTLKFPGIKINE